MRRQPLTPAGADIVRDQILPALRLRQLPGVVGQIEQRVRITAARGALGHEVLQHRQARAVEPLAIALAIVDRIDQRVRRLAVRRTQRQIV